MRKINLNSISKFLSPTLSCLAIVYSFYTDINSVNITNSIHTIYKSLLMPLFEGLCYRATAIIHIYSLRKIKWKRRDTPSVTLKMIWFLNIWGPVLWIISYYSVMKEMFTRRKIIIPISATFWRYGYTHSTSLSLWRNTDIMNVQGMFVHVRMLFYLLKPWFKFVSYDFQR